MKRMVSVVVPVFNEEGNLRELITKLAVVLESQLNLTYEVIFIDDGSKDSSWEIISDLNRINSNIKGIRFSRNFGHQNALKAGLDTASGDAVITMDADLQHPPELLAEFIEKWSNGGKVVQGIRLNTRGVGILKKVSSGIYYRLLSYLSDIQIRPGSSDFRLIDRQVVEEFRNMRESHLCIRGIIPWLGFEETFVEYNAPERFSGETKFTLSKMFRFAVDGIMSFSVKPLKLSILAGLLVSLLAFMYIGYALLASLVFRVVIPGWTSILVSVLFLGGIQLISIGILGEYIGKLFIENKRRKNYIVREKI